MTAKEPATALRDVTPVLLLLATGTFAVGTDAFVISGLLPDMAADLKTSVSTMGQLVTLFAVAYAISAPLVAALTGSWNRRLLLLSAQVVFVIGMLLQAAGPTALVVAIGRVVAAVGAAGFTSAAAAVAGVLVAPNLRGRALAIVLGGMTIATVLGVPLGVSVSRWFHWRTTLLAVAGLGVIAAIGALAVPSMKLPIPSLKVRLAALRRPGALPTLLVTVALLSGGFTMYTYVAPLLSPVVRGSDLAWVLFLYGCSGAVGNALAGRWTDKVGALPVLRIGIAGVGLSGLFMPFASHHFYAMLVVVIVWPMAGWLTAVPQQHRLIATAPDVAPVLLGWNASANYAGIAIGAALGGFVMHTSSTSWLGPAAAACTLVALMLTKVPTSKPAPALSTPGAKSA